MRESALPCALSGHALPRGKPDTVERRFSAAFRPQNSGALAPEVRLRINARLQQCPYPRKKSFVIPTNGRNLLVARVSFYTIPASQTAFGRRRT